MSGATISATSMFYVERSTTSDMPDGRPLPPADGHVWCLVHRVDGATLWRRIFVSSGADGARRRGTKERAPQRKDHTNG